MPVVDDEPLTPAARTPSREASGAVAVTDPDDDVVGRLDEAPRRAPADGSRVTAAPAWLARLLLAVGLAVAVLPAGLSARRALADGWRPVLDNEHLAVDAASFAHGHPPLLGAHSTSLEVTTRIRPVHHLGPSEAWLLGTVQVGWPGTRSLVVSVAALAAAAAAVIVLASGALSGPWGALVAGAVTGMVAARLGTPVLADIWNPYVPILPLAAAATSAWASALVRWRPGLPLAVLFGTISAQSHLSHGPLVVAAVAPAVFAWWLRRRRSARGRAGAGTLIAGLIAVVLWFPPVLSELTARHSNLVNLWRAGTRNDGSALGSGYGLEVFTRVVGRPPPFGPPAIGWSVWVVPRAISLTLVLRLLFVLIPAIAMLVFGGRRRDRVLLVVGTSILITDAVALLLLSISTYSSGAAIYQTRWLWSVAILHWAGVAMAGVHVVGSSPVGGRRPWQPTASIAVGSVAVVLAVGAAAAAIRPPLAAAVIPPGVRTRMDAAAELQAGLAGEIRHHRRLLVRAESFISPTTNVGLDLAATLITEGVDVRISSPDPELRRTFGGRYAARPGETGELLVVTDRLGVADMTRRGYEPVAATPRLTAAEHRRLAASARVLRAAFEGSDIGWSRYGAAVNLTQDRPDIDQLLHTNGLGTAIFGGELQGRLPSRQLVQTFTDLRRRDRPVTSYIVWRRSGRRP